MSGVYEGLDSEETDFLNSKDEAHRPQAWLSISHVILCTSTLLFASISITQFLKGIPCQAQSAHQGYQTEWAIAEEAIQLRKQVIFGSALKYNATSDLFYRDSDPGTIQYVGTPTPEIDQAWLDLLAGQYLVLPKEEALRLDNPVSIDGTYLGEVEVMHSLHCLNTIRRAIDKEYYAFHDPHPLPENIKRVHIEHCLDQLRQAIQCAADLTPVLLRPYGVEPNVNLIGTAQAHTCRDWDVFRKWYSERGDKWGKFDGGGT